MGDHAIKLYWFGLSHPGWAVVRMLDLKGLGFESVTVLPGMQRVQLRLLGFRHGTVPAMRLDGRRIQGSRPIARALEALVPDPPLYPQGDARAAVLEAERWGDEVFQDVPRRIMRWGLVHDIDLRAWLAADAGLPAPAISARLSGASARYYARVVHADEAAVRRELAGLQANLDRVDALLADGTLTLDPPNAATLQVLSTVRALDAIADLHDAVSAHACAAPARELFAAYPAPAPAFLPEQLRALVTTAA